MVPQVFSVKEYIRKIIYTLKMEGKKFAVTTEVKFAPKPDDAVVIKPCQEPIYRDWNR